MGDTWRVIYPDKTESIMNYNPILVERKNLVKQIKSELRFLNCQGIKYLVHEADLGACHEDSRTINARKEKLKKQLRNLNQTGSAE